MRAIRIFVVILSLVSLGVVSAQAGVPNVVNYQGTIKDSDGMLLSEDHDLVFKIYASESGGTALWTETHLGVPFENGVFSVVLGEGETFPSDLFDQADRWIGVTVDSDDDEMSPRMRFTSSPYAMRASVADIALNGGSGELELPFSGTCAVDGNYAFTLINDGSEGKGLQVHVTDDVSNTQTYSGYFRSDGPQGVGVYAYTPGSNSHAIWGNAMGETGVGVVGYAYYDGPNTNFGGTFVAYGQTGRGVYGVANNESPEVLNYGGYFRADGGLGYGAAGVANGLKGRGVVGHATSTGPDRTYGGFFVSSSEIGVGVFGRTENTGGRGVWGQSESTSTSSRHYGGYFTASEGGEGVGLRAIGSKYGIQASSTGGGRAGMFEGDIEVTNMVTCHMLWSHDGLISDGGGDVAAKFIGGIEIMPTGGSFVDDPIVEIGDGLDYAEGFDLSENQKVEAGTVLIIDECSPGELKISDSEYDTKVAGIVAGAEGLGSGICLGANSFDCEVAVAGRVYCNVDARENGVKPGDLLTTSSLPGYAMVVTDNSRATGAILGKAMGNLEAGKMGRVLVLVGLQ